MLNRATLVGHLGADPEVRRTQDGRPIVNFSLATSENWKDKTTGEKKEATEWHRVVIFNEGLCGIAEKYLKKGSRVHVEGMIRTRKWVAQDGTDRWSTEIVLQNFSAVLLLLDRAERAPQADEDDYGARPSAPGRAAGAGAGETATRSTASRTVQGGMASQRPLADMDDEIPF